MTRATSNPVVLARLADELYRLSRLAHSASSLASSNSLFLELTPERRDIQLNALDVIEGQVEQLAAVVEDVRRRLVPAEPSYRERRAERNERDVAALLVRAGAVETDHQLTRAAADAACISCEWLVLPPLALEQIA